MNVDFRQRRAVSDSANRREGLASRRDSRRRCRPAYWDGNTVRRSAAIGLVFALLDGSAAAHAAGCPGNPGAMGTSRVLTIDPREYPRLGTMQYPETLPLADKEVVLTFDDGPMPPYTNRVLEVLAQECVKANYFIIGRMARGYPDLLRRIHAEGHVIGTHSENHPLAFEKMPARAVQQEIEQGIASTARALGNRDAIAPFFRIPGLLRAETVESYLRSRGIVTWSADVAADDWKHVTASEVVNRSIARLDAKGKGILLLHDIQPATALALPHLLRELKRRGYKIVQVAPASAPALVAGAPQQFPSPSPNAQSAAAPQPFPATTPPAALVAHSWPVPSRRGATEAGAAAQAAASAPSEPKPAEIKPAEIEPAELKPAEIEPAETKPVPPPVAVTARATPAAVDDAELSPAIRTMPVPILEVGRPRPAGTDATAEAAEPQTTRPLTPGFKPSHSASPSAKVSEPPLERRMADPWAMRAELAPGAKPR
jgi:peptidoglycan/xylan/chitin deacetylase (PgdA/CDA1 family)